MLACGRELVNELETCFSNLNFSYKRCTAHVINLAVKAEMKYLNASIIKLRKFEKVLRYYLMISGVFVKLKIKNFSCQYKMLTRDGMLHIR